MSDNYLYTPEVENILSLWLAVCKWIIRKSFFDFCTEYENWPDNFIFKSDAGWVRHIQFVC